MMKKKINITTKTKKKEKVVARFKREIIGNLKFTFFELYVTVVTLQL